MTSTTRFTAALILASSLALAQDPFSRENELQIGKQMADDARTRWPVVQNPILQKYVERIAANIGRGFSGSPFPFQFTIIDDRQARVMTEEPLAYPGGYIMVRTGLFLAAENEAEFAAMLAHAMAHTTGRHAARSLSRAQSDKLTESSAQPGTGAKVPIKYADLARSYELEADKAAMRMLSDAGYPPIALLNYIDRTQFDTPDSAASPIPSRNTRLNALRDALKPLMGRTFPSNTEFLRMQDEVKRLRYSIPKLRP